nr:hypothetical protein [Tanacetum cinerariifolium]
MSMLLGNVRSRKGQKMQLITGKRCYCEEAGIQLNAEQADWKDDTGDEFDDQELEAHYMYMAKIQEVSPDAVDSGPIFDTEPEQKIDQNDEDADLSEERELLASLIVKLKCEIELLSFGLPSIDQFNYWVIRALNYWYGFPRRHYNCDPLVLETKSTPVEESTGVLESMFGEDELALESTTLALFKLDSTFLGWSSNSVSLAFLSVRRILFFFVLSLDYDPLALETKATPVEERTGVTATRCFLDQ